MSIERKHAVLGRYAFILLENVQNHKVCKSPFSTVIAEFLPWLHAGTIGAKSP